MQFNTKRLARIAINTRVDHPRMKGYYTGYDGIGRILPGTGGITYNFAIGDNCMVAEGDHIEPGVTMANPSQGENMAAMSLCCVGNQVTVLSGPAKGARGFVTGKHGGVNHIMAWFPSSDIENMTGKEDFLIKSVGQGLDNGTPIRFMNLDPIWAQEMVRNVDGKSVIPVRKVFGSYLIGAGLGTGTLVNGDMDIMTQDREEIRKLGLDDLCFGDLVAITDLYCAHGPHFHKGALTIGVITHSDSYSSGHGPGITVIATDKSYNLAFAVEETANLKTWIEQFMER